MKINKNFFDFLVSCLLVIVYICIQYIFPEKFSSISAYASYFFDIFLVIAAWSLISPRFNFKFFNSFSISRIHLFLLIFLFFGMVVHFMAIRFHFSIPFNLDSNTIIIFLLVISPILEELVFRYALWKLGLKIYNQKYFVLFFTSLFFSFSHLYAYWFVPKEFQNFIIYQAGYTLLLGLSFGYFRQKYSSLLLPVIAHGAFNLGFYIAKFL